MIDTERLILKPYQPDDAAALVANANRPEVARMMESIRLPFTESDALKRIAERQCTQSGFTFALHEKASGSVIGEIGAGGAPHPRLGYFLHPDAWGKGYASEALVAALDHAFETLGWPVMDADCFDDNPASIRTLEKAGFIRFGAAECQSQAREEDSPTSVFRLTRAHWATPVLTTERLTLRPYRAEDAARSVLLLNDFEVSSMLSPVAFPYTRELADEWVSGALWKSDDIHFVIDDGTGLIGAASLSTSEDCRQTGFWLGRSYWGRGLMSEAFARMLRWTFTIHRDTRIISYAFVDNPGSQRVHKKAGFIAGETVEHHSAARGEAIDAISYALERTDWQARQ